MSNYLNVNNLSAQSSTLTNTNILNALTSLSLVNGTFSNIAITNETATNSTITNLNAQSSTLTNTSILNAISSINIVNGTFSNISATNISTTNLTVSNEVATNATVTNLKVTNELATNITTTNLSTDTIISASQPFFSLTALNGSAQSISNNTSTELSSYWNTTGSISQGTGITWTSNGRLTVANAGLYYANACVGFSNNATGIRTFSLYINGSSTNAVGYVEIPPTNGASTSSQVGRIVKLAANDYVSCFVNQTSGGALAMLNSAVFTISITKLY
jgi:hypothetical protein